VKLAVLLAGAALVLGGCAVTPPPDTSQLPPGALGGNADPDMMAINTAEWAFANPARTRGNVVNGIRAVVSIDYLAGELSSSPRWDFMSSLTKQQMLAARLEVRQALGIEPNAPSQAVVNALLALSVNPTPATANQLLRPPVFTLPPQETLARLDNLPYLPIANRASLRAGQQQYPSNGPSCLVCD
jgi:hypothetical protein